MRKILLPTLILVSFFTYGQKIITCKKGDVKQNSQLIAEYDGKGSMFKMFTLGVFAPGSKDTLIAINEFISDPQNPLWPGSEVVYKIQFRDADKTSMYLQNPKTKTNRVYERDILEFLFNDTVPVLVKEAKLDETAVKEFKQKYHFDYDKVAKFMKDVEDSIAIINKPNADRDKTKPVTFTVVNDNSFSKADTDQLFEIRQAGVLLGRLQKKVEAIGSFPKANYVFWKVVTPVTINGIDFKFSPLAICKSGPSTFGIDVIAVAGKKTYEVKGDYSALETVIANTLIANGLL